MTKPADSCFARDRRLCTLQWAHECSTGLVPAQRGVELQHSADGLRPRLMLAVRQLNDNVGGKA